MTTSWDPGPRPEWVEAVNAGLIVPIAIEAELPLDRDALLAEALVRQGRSGDGVGALTAPGPGTGEDFLEPLDIVLASLEGEAELHVLGRWITRRFILRLLEVRLQICDAVRSDPGLRDEQIIEPLFVIGAPRTGTTILHALLAADERHRVPLGWEFLRPVPSPVIETRESDTRIGLADAELRLPGLVTSGLGAIHAYGGQMTKECLSAMSFTFRSEEFISRYNTLSYINWLSSCDMTPAYEMHRLVLQILQRRMPTSKWVLKSPVHLHNLPALLNVYPDAQLIVTHRDPLAILGSVTSLIATLRYAHSDHVDTTTIGRYHSDLYLKDLDGLVDLVGTAAFARDRVAHGSFAEFNRNGVAVVNRMYAELGIDLPDEVSGAMASALSDRPREKLGAHGYSFEWLGLDPDIERTRFSRYVETFEVESEAGADSSPTSDVS
ncbi:Sulfotransferase family [Acidimicrobiia bacterium]